MLSSVFRIIFILIGNFSVPPLTEALSGFIISKDGRERPPAHFIKSHGNDHAANRHGSSALPLMFFLKIDFCVKSRHLLTIITKYGKITIKATPHNLRRTACLNLVPSACPKNLSKATALLQFFVQPDEKSYNAIRTPELCGVA